VLSAEPEEHEDEMQGVRDALALLTALFDMQAAAGDDTEQLQVLGCELLYPLIAEVAADPNPMRVGSALLALLYMVDGMIAGKVGHDAADKLEELRVLAGTLTVEGFAG
jgi:hypothetical protein